MDFEELDDEASAMAAAMGFASFGSHKPAKKRKFNAATDAFVSGQELDAIDRGGKKGKGSGGNNIPLGKLRQFGNEKKSTIANHDEINENDDEEEDIESAAIRRTERSGEAFLPASKMQKLKTQTQSFIPGLGQIAVDYGPTQRKVPGDDTISLENRKPIRTKMQLPPISKTSQNGRNGDEIDLEDEDESEDISTSKVEEREEADGPAYIDTSEPAPIEKTAPPIDLEAIEMQARIDALLASIEAAPPRREQEPPQDFQQETLLPPPPADLALRHPFGHSGFAMGGARGGHGRQGGGAFSDTASVASSRLSHGEKNLRWFEDYYDPTSNQNPWQKLEEEKGITSVGNWLAPNDRSRQDV